MSTRTAATASADGTAPAATRPRRRGTPSPGADGNRRRTLFYVGALVVLAASIALTTPLGVDGVTYGEAAQSALARLGIGGTPLPGLLDSLLWDLRLPRVLMAAIVGALLAVSGVTLQTVTGNALAEPYLLGIASGASAGAVAVVVLGLGGSVVGLTGGAFIGAVASFALLMALLWRKVLRPITIVLTGVVIGQLFSAVSSLILMSAGDAEATRSLTHWLLGSLAPSRWENVVICGAALAVCGGIIWARSGALDGLALGSETATALGIRVNANRIVFLILTAFLTAAAVASVGAIGFVGLIVPHAMRYIVGPGHKALLPASALTGAVFLIWTDALARMAFAPQVVPVGVFTALIGVPVFLLLLRRRGDI
ncbi:FecCD family ABC transporter permease [Salininema proteolyticum]|uniref:FecCD family ABC transporter permease n=1 Tax=Salininema proteolyticum TaxID=1607685 RepID=A0ABV8TV75_9ACTN